ncbi:protein fuzzy homolog isoform X1 [Branchiostoma floridae x Branchiostoma japonicum]
MAAYLFCLTTGGGVPLFTRSKPDLKPLPYPVIGSLNGVHMFGANHDANLVSTTTEHTKLVWRVYHDSITLIVISVDQRASDSQLQRFLDNVFNSMVLLLGLDELITIKNVERLKRDLRSCYRLIDCLMECSEMYGDVTGCVDVIVCQEQLILQDYLDSFVNSADSTFGCLLVSGKVAVATTKWWDLTGQEMYLLSLLARVLPPGSSKDIPVYLPHGSPNVPHRLLNFQILQGVEVCVLCGPTPSLTEVETELLDRYWRPSMESLRSCLRINLRGFPSNITVHIGVLGLIIMNVDLHKCLGTVHPLSSEESQKQGKSLSIARRRDILRSFYQSVTGTVFPPTPGTTPPEVVENGHGDGLASESPVEPHTEFVHSALDTYVIGEDHKCYATREGPYQIYVLFSKDVPKYALRSISMTTLSSLTKDKLF